uniref:GST N-terminal domain-containing protein n=1 Tax=Rhabditophanes sp. KR3021 TaxID=114890 RepID=A0AC35TL00_9BILA
MVGKTTLTYFNGMGRAEVARILLNYGGQEFNDVRVSFEEWPKIKEQQPFKQLPVLEVDGVKIGQACAFEQLLASRFKLLGKNDIETALIQQFVLAIDDVQLNAKPMYYEKDEEKKKIMTKAYLADNVAPFLKLISGVIAKSGLLVGSSISYADISLFQFLWAW